MEVRMPDGTVLRGIPEGTSKEDVMAKFNSTKAKPIKYKPEDYAVPPGQQGATPIAKYAMQAEDVIKSLKEQAEIKGGGAPMRLEEARNLSAFDKYKIALGSRAQKFGAGIRETGNTLGGVMSMANEAYLPKGYVDKANELSGGFWDADKYIRQNRELSAEQKDIDNLTEEFSQVSGVPGFLGDATAYGALELATGPVSAKAAGEIGGLISGAATKVGQKTAKESSRFAKWLESSQAKPIHDLGQFGREKIGEPISKLAKRYVGRDRVGNPNRIGALKDFGQGVGTGAVTGIVDHDLSLADGVLSGAVGNLTGSALTRPLSKRYNSNNAAAKETIEFMRDQKYRVDPGTYLGNNALYGKFAGLQNDDYTSEIMKTYKRANQKVNNRIAYGAMGVPEDQVENMTTSRFKQVMDEASGEFEKLAALTKGHITKEENSLLQQHFAKIIKNPASDDALIKQMEGVRKYLELNTFVTRAPGSNKFQKATFNGQNYQEMRTLLKNNMDSAFNKGDLVTANAYKPVVKMLDDSLEEGMKRGGKINPAQWKDARERWAMGHIVRDSADPATMDIDALKLYGKLKADPRMMTGASGRIDPLMKVGKMARLEQAQKQETGMLSSAKLHNVGKGHKSLFGNLIANPLTRSVAPADEVYVDSFMKGWPSPVYGVAGMNRYDGVYKPSTFTRPMSQAGQVWPTAIDAGATAADKVMNPTRSMKELKAWWDKEEEEELYQ